MTYTPMQLALAFIKTGELNEAVDALDQQLHNMPDDYSARRLRAQVLQRLERYDDALADLNAIPEPTADDQQQRSILLERMGAVNAALNAMRDALAQAPANSPQQERMAERLLNLLIAQGDFDAALTLVQAQPQSWRWQQRTSDLLMLRHEHEAAISGYSAVIAHIKRDFDPTDANAQALRARVLLARGHAHRHTGAYEAAQQDYQAAKAIMSADASIDFYAGLLRYLMGERAAATQLCKQALADSPSVVRDGLLTELDAAQFAELREQLL